VLYLKHKSEREPNQVLIEILSSTLSFPLQILHMPTFSTKDPQQLLNNDMKSENIVNIYSFVKENGLLPEAHAHYIILQIIHLVNECKRMHMFPKIISRSNIYINTHNLNVQVVIPRASEPFERTPQSLSCTTYYLPPEWIKCKQYKAESLLTWNIGVLLFFMLYNKMPFTSRWEILHSPAVLNTHKSSLDANLFIGWCLAKNPSKRITLKECLHHPWITQNFI